jgi:hypothetical protein
MENSCKVAMGTDFSTKQKGNVLIESIIMICLIMELLLGVVSVHKKYRQRFQAIINARQEKLLLYPGYSP